MLTPSSVCVPPTEQQRSLRRLRTFALCALTSAVSYGAPATYEIQGFDLNAYEKPRLVRLADAALKHEIKTIVSIRNSRSEGGRHDFSSDGDYWWPNPSDPTGPYIQKDGQSNPENFSAHRALLFSFASDVATLGAAFKVTGDSRYSTKALEYLRAWFIDDSTRMNPNLNNAQATRNKTQGHGTGIIDGVHLAEVALSVEYLRDAGALPEIDATAIQAWFRAFHHWLRDSPDGKEDYATENDHATCWLLQAAAYARLTKDEPALDEYRRRFKEVLLPNQMGPDGSFPKETARTKPYAYSLFNLDAMCGVAQILSTRNENLLQFTLPDGRSLLKGIDFMAPFIADKSKWPERPDIVNWKEWPVRQPALLFGALSSGRGDWLDLWRRLPADPKVDEIRKNMPIKQPVLWVRSAASN